MKIVKFSSFILFAALLTSMFMSDLNAKRHSSFSFNLNLVPNIAITPAPRYVEYGYVAPHPAYVAVRPYRSHHSAYVQRVYYPAHSYREVVFADPYTERAYVRPHYAYPGY